MSRCFSFSVGVRTPITEIQGFFEDESAGNVFFSNNIYGLDCLLVSTVSCPIVDTTGLILQVLATFQVQMTCSTNGLSRSATKVDYQQESFP